MHQLKQHIDLLGYNLHLLIQAEVKPRLPQIADLLFLGEYVS